MTVGYLWRRCSSLTGLCLILVYLVRSSALLLSLFQRWQSCSAELMRGLFIMNVLRVSRWWTKVLPLFYSCVSALKKICSANHVLKGAPVCLWGWHRSVCHSQYYLLLFSRLKTLTTESSVIVAALQKSKTGLLEISEDKTKIRRSPDKPLPEMNDEYKDTLKHKSVYIVRISTFIVQ